MTKNIAINALGLKNNSGGVETYTYNLLKALLENDKDNKYYLFIGNNVKSIFSNLSEFSNLKIVSYPIDTNNSTIRVIAENSFLPLDLIIKRINLVHHVCNYMPRINPIKSIVTLHDMVAFFYQETYPDYKNMQRFYNYFKKAMDFTANKAQKIITVSNFTKNEFLKHYNLSNDKVRVIGESIDTRKKKHKPNLETLKNSNINKPYLLSVSVIRPHKNLDFLVRVFNKMKEKYNIPHQLVIAGGIHFGGEKFLAEIEKSPYKDDIKYLGYIKDEDLASLYTYADTFIFPSLYEGFGIPVLEALEYGIPVISSNKASMPEVGGEGVNYFNPYDENDACDTIHKILNEENIAKDLLEKQLSIFNWDKIAHQFINLFNEIA